MEKRRILELSQATKFLSYLNDAFVSVDTINKLYNKIMGSDK